VRENLTFFGEVFGVTGAEQVRRSEELLHFAGLAEFANRRAAALSGGMQKKLGLACALVHRPKVLLLDEPTGGVDPIARQEFWQLLIGLLRAGSAVLVSTPYMDEAMRTMEPVLGPVWSNAPLKSQFKLENSSVSKENTCVDYGEEEFTKGRPHPAIDPSVRRPAILKEAGDPEVAVILLDFILTPPGHMEPVGYVLDDIKTAMDMAKAEGRKLVFIGTILGTDADLQNKKEQSEKLQEAGVVVCKTNHTASRLATEIIKILKERA